jgi:RND family efflux transporter MFP subunit
VRKSPIVVRFKVGERHIGEVRRRMAGPADNTTPAAQRSPGPGLPIQIRVDAYPREPFRGAIVRVAPALDVASRTVAVEAELENKDGRLMPGMFCRVALDLGTRQQALLVPLRALVTRRGRNPDGDERRAAARVFVVRDRRARLTQIQLGAEDAGKGKRAGDDGGRGEVLSGLEQGQQVVVEGHDSLEDGARVEVVAEGAPPAGKKPTKNTKKGGGG